MNLALLWKLYEYWKRLTMIGNILHHRECAEFNTHEDRKKVGVVPESEAVGK
jgi:hypothetical protein